MVGTLRTPHFLILLPFVHGLRVFGHLLLFLLCPVVDMGGLMRPVPHFAPLYSLHLLPRTCHGFRFFPRFVNLRGDLPHSPQSLLVPGLLPSQVVPGMPQPFVLSDLVVLERS